MNPLLSILWSLARVFVAMAFSWLVAKGWISDAQAKSASPEVVSCIVLGIVAVITTAHAQWQKYQAGLLLRNSSSTSTKTIGSLPPKT